MLLVAGASYWLGTRSEHRSELPTAASRARPFRCRSHAALARGRKPPQPQVRPRRRPKSILRRPPKCGSRARSAIRLTRAEAADARRCAVEAPLRNRAKPKPTAQRPPPRLRPLRRSRSRRPLRLWPSRVVAGRLRPAGADRRLRHRCSRPSSAGGTWSVPIRRSRSCPRWSARRAIRTAAIFYRFRIGHHLAGPFRSAVPAHGADPLQLRGRRLAVEGEGVER